VGCKTKKYSRSGIIDPTKRLGKSSLLFEQSQIGTAATGCVRVKGIFYILGRFFPPLVQKFPAAFSAIEQSFLPFTKRDRRTAITAAD